MYGTVSVVYNKIQQFVTIIKGMTKMKLLFTVFFSVSTIISVCAQNVYVNQVGYLLDQEKLVYFTQSADSFYVTDKSDGSIQYSGKIEPSVMKDPATGADVYYGNFSTLTRGGLYVVKTNTNLTSDQFEISSSPFTDVYKKSLKGFYFQRCGTALLSANAGVYARAACHLNDGTFHPTTGKSGSINVTGGWHDAGDFGKYVVNAGVTIGTLLMGYEQFPDYFKSDDLNIPESGNSVPDILDEVRYELTWMLKMQDTDGGVFFKVTPKNFAGFIMPNTDNSVRYIYQKSSTATGDFAAVMAMAARIYFPFDSAFASKCLGAAENAWQYLLANPSIVPSGGFHNPSDTYTGEYGDNNDADERLWAAGELFTTTGNDIYENYYALHYQNVGLIYYAMGWGSVGTLAQIEYLVSKQPKTDSGIKAAIKTSLINYCNQLYNKSKSDGFNVTLSTSDYYWGSNAVVLNNAVLLIMGYQLSGNKNYYNTALEQLNYILGANINDISYITGVGTKYPMHIHHRTSAADGIVEPVPGLMAGGPNKNITNDPILQAKFTSSTPPALCYVDDQGSYASNEIAINWNAPLVFVAGYFSGDKSITNVHKETGSVPANFNIEQNYPNPFNPSTVISYNLAKTSDVTLTIFNTLGQEVATLVNDQLQTSGKYNITWNGKNSLGKSLSSGVYIYQLRTNYAVLSKKMMMMK